MVYNRHAVRQEYIKSSLDVPGRKWIQSGKHPSLYVFHVLPLSIIFNNFTMTSGFSNLRKKAMSLNEKCILDLADCSTISHCRFLWFDSYSLNYLVYDCKCICLIQPTR
jgi:hypothetical protein